MLLTTYNLINYILQSKWNGEFNVLSNILKLPIEITDLDSDNPRNKLLKIEIDNSHNQSFVFKQAKYLLNGASSYINTEARFYESFRKLTFKTQLDFNYNTLILPCLNRFPVEDIINNNTVDIGLVKSVSKYLSGFHKKLKISTNENVKNFCDNEFVPFVTPYHNFYALILRGYRRYDFLDEMVFSILTKKDYKIIRRILYDFIYSKIFKSLNEFEKTWENSYLIHGDIKHDNIFLKAQNRLIFIDYELISQGDNAWDLACLIESIMYKLFYQRSYSSKELAYNIFYHLISNYKEDKNDEFFLRRVLRFWGLKKLERYRTRTLLYSDFLKNLIVIEKLFNRTDEFVTYFEKGDQKLYELFEYE